MEAQNAQIFYCPRNKMKFHIIIHSLLVLKLETLQKNNFKIC